MIEVEKKFQPTEEQLAMLLSGAEFLKEKDMHDVYYDFPDLRIAKQNIRLRDRKGRYELKISLPKNASGVALHNEIENDFDILKHLGFSGDENLDEVVKNQMIVLADMRANRKEYKKGEFIIDVDVTDFGYDMCEIELMVEDESGIALAEEKIINLAKSCGIEIKDLPGKTVEYLRLKKPEIYKELYGNKVR